MGATSSAFKVVQNAIGSYKIEAAGWKRDHDAAMKFYDFEDFLLVGIALFDAITQFDEKHRSRVLSGESPFDPEHTQTIQGAYRWWLEPCEKITVKLEELRAEFGPIKNSEEFLSRCREAKGILTDDAEYFTDKALIALRDEAVGEFRAGNTIECG